MTVQLCKDCVHCEDRHEGRHDLAYCRAPRFRITCIVSGEHTWKSAFCTHRREDDPGGCPDFNPLPPPPPATRPAPELRRAIVLRASVPTRWAAIIGHQMRMAMLGLCRYAVAVEARLARLLTRGIG